jgi:hypothetical protein
MNHTLVDRIEFNYARTLERIGTLKELAEYEAEQRQQNTDTLDALERATARAIAYAQALGLEYDSEYDC